MAKDNMAEKIKMLRSERGLTLEQVANVVGVGKSTVRKWETGMIANMRRDKIAKLAEALHTTPAYLMGWEDEPESAAPEPLTPAEHELIRLYRKLDENDRRETRRYISDFLLAKPKYLYEEKRGYA